MCLCDPSERITCGYHLLREIRGREDRERRTVRLASSLIAEAEWLCRDAAKPTEETP